MMFLLLFQFVISRPPEKFVLDLSHEDRNHDETLIVTTHAFEKECASATRGYHLQKSGRITSITHIRGTLILRRSWLCLSSVPLLQELFLCALPSNTGGRSGDNSRITILSVRHRTRGPGSDLSFKAAPAQSTISRPR